MPKVTGQRNAAGIVVVRDSQLLLIEFPKVSHLQETIGLITGYIDGKETAKEAACRELFEESGLKTELEKLSSFPQNTITVNNNDSNTFTIEFFITTHVTGKLKGSREGKPFWVNIDEALEKLELLPHNKEIIENALKYLQQFNPKISIIAAVGKNRELGKTGKIPWYIPGELQRFKQITMGSPIIMGRKTFESIGRVLPGRMNIIITRNTKYHIENAHIENSLKKAITIAKEEKHREIFIIGGGEIYKQALPLADKLYLTIIDKSFEADTYFPKYENLFTKEISKSEAFQSNDMKYYFVELERN